MAPARPVTFESRGLLVCPTWPGAADLTRAFVAALRDSVDAALVPRTVASLPSLGCLALLALPRHCRVMGCYALVSPRMTRMRSGTMLSTAMGGCGGGRASLPCCFQCGSLSSWAIEGAAFARDGFERRGDRLR
jgi:hypothetical protein